MNRPGLRALVLAAALAAAAAPRAARASKADAFEGKVQPVSGQLYRKAGRFELTGGGLLSLNDAFFTKYFAGAKLGYHFNEYWSLHATFSSGAAAKTDSAVVCPVNRTCHAATQTELNQVPGRIDRIVGAELQFSPIYGKLNVFAERVVHFDLSVLGGADLITHDKVIAAPDAGDPAAILAAAQRQPQVSTPGFHVGLGARLFLSEAFAIRAEVKDYVYQVDVPSVGRKDVQNQLFTELGISLFFPFHNRAQP